MPAYAENKQVDIQSETNPFSMRYGACLIINDYSGEPFDQQQQEKLAGLLTELPGTPLKRVAIDTDETTGYMEVDSIVEAGDEADAMRIVSRTLLRAIIATHHDPECIELMEAHLEYEEQLKQDAPDQDPIATIAEADYTKDQIPTMDLDSFDEQVVVDPREVFYSARSQVIN